MKTPFSFASTIAITLPLFVACAGCASQADTLYRGEALAIVSGTVETGNVTAPASLNAAVAWAAGGSVQKDHVSCETLTCKPGYEPSRRRRQHSHVQGAAPVGRCKAIAKPSDDCVDILTLTCESGYARPKTVARNPMLKGATPLGRCVAQ